MACWVCGKSKISKCFTAHEMMFGTKEKFTYLECEACKSVQIETIPDTLQKYYPKEYYSHTRNNSSFKKRSIKEFLSINRDRYGLGLNTWLGWALNKYKPSLSTWSILKATGVGLDHKVLDIGCGSAAVLLNLMASRGFTNLQGIDPFIEQDVVNNGIPIWKRYIHEMEGGFDLIMLHHSLEHMGDPQSVLKQAKACLNTNGKCLVRVPTVSSDAWEIYGTDWVQLDAPRHLFIPSREGMQSLATASGFFIEQVIDDSTKFQFVASELYKKDIPLNKQVGEQHFSPQALEKFHMMSEDANISQRGDQAAFILKPA